MWMTAPANDPYYDDQHCSLTYNFDLQITLILKATPTITRPPLFPHVPSGYVLLFLPAALVSLISGGVAPFMTIAVGQAFDAFAKFPLSNPKSTLRLVLAKTSSNKKSPSKAEFMARQRVNGAGG
jgi:hypothetical protein